MRNYNLLGVFLGIIAVFFLGVILQQLRTVLLPFTVAILLSIIFKPTVVWLKAKRMPTAVSLVGVLIAFFLVVFLLGWFLYASAGTFLRELPKYEVRIGDYVAGLEIRLIEALQPFEVDLSQISWSNALSVTSVTALLSTGVGTFLSFLGTTFMVVLFMLFILAGSGDLVNKIRKAFPPAQSDRISKVVANVDDQVRRYLVAKTAVSLGTGLLTFVVLVSFGVDFPVVWAFLAFVLNYVPNLGSLVAVLFPVLLSLVQFESPAVSLVIAILLVTIQTVMGNVVEPRVMGFRLNLSPLFILVSLIFWGWLWGIWGMVLAVPLTATIKIVFENLEPLQPISVLMSGWTDDAAASPQSPATPA